MKIPLWFRQKNHAAPFTDERVVQLMTNSERDDLLSALINLYEELDDQHPHAVRGDADHGDARQNDVAQEVRRAFLLVLRDTEDVAEEERLAHFLAHHIEPDDYADVHWETPEQVIVYCEVLYSFRFEKDTTAEQVTAHVNHLLRHALHYFEQRSEQEKMFRLLQIAPISPEELDPELLRLRNRAYLYEMRRVRRHRRILYGYLLLQVVLILVVFPLLFINAENGVLQDTIESTTEVDLPEEPRVRYRYVDGLYWSLITAASIGYGDITPQSELGKVIAATLGVMGVITIGVIAGLILNWITMRRLD